MAVNDVSSEGSASPYRRAHYQTSAHRIAQLPPDSGFEVAFAGRSNAGKSTAINAITGQKALARTSKTPGRTQQIVIFDLDPERRLADLPGYGYAKVAQSLRQHWRLTLDRYFRERGCLRGLMLIMDIRHPLKPFERQMLHWCRAADLACHILLTKADKLKRGPAGNVRRQVTGELQRERLSATLQTFSGASGAGVDEARKILDGWFGLS